MRMSTVAVVSLTFSLVSCQGDSPTSPSTQAAITVSVSPDPGMAEASSDPDFPWSVDFTVTIRETAGIGVAVDRVRVLSGDVTIDFDASDVIAAAGTNQISARGTLAVPLGIFYATESGDRGIDANIEVQCTDNEGNVITRGVSWSAE